MAGRSEHGWQHRRPASLPYYLFRSELQPFQLPRSIANEALFVMSTAAREYGQDAAHEKLSAQVIVKQPGYMYIYLSNEETSCGIL